MNPADFTHSIQGTYAWEAIREFYGQRRAERSQVPLINHIIEGVGIIGEISRLTERRHDSSIAAQAYCLHPLFQNDAELTSVGLKTCRDYTALGQQVLVCTMEYRWRANNWLSKKVKFCHYNDGAPPTLVTTGKPDPGPLSAVRMMLIADKVQNYKDFLVHHAQTHERRHELDLYFKTWLKALEVDDSLFAHLSQVASQVVKECAP